MCAFYIVTCCWPPFFKALICVCLGICINGGEVMLVTEFCGGGDLRTYVAHHKPLEEKLLLKLLSGVAAGNVSLVLVTVLCGKYILM